MFEERTILTIIGVIFGVVILVTIIIAIVNAREKEKKRQEYLELEKDVLAALGYENWNFVPRCDEEVIVKSRQTLEKYTALKYFQDNRSQLEYVKQAITRKEKIAQKIMNFILDGQFKDRPQYEKIQKQLNIVLNRASAYRIKVKYISQAGNNLGERELIVSEDFINNLRNNPALLMSKTEYNKLLKEQQKKALEDKQKEYYNKVNSIIDLASKAADLAVIKGSREKIDNQIERLYDRTVNSIKKVKSASSEEWSVIEEFISSTQKEIAKVLKDNQLIIKYYASKDFQKIKETCEVLMSSQREFNEYINEKVQSISQLFGTRMSRNDTVNNDEYAYIRPYKKTITPYTAEVSAAVFASAENNPMEYLVKNFYANKSLYPEQIQKLHLLLGELETLREAKKIIENYKAEYKQYLGNVPKYVMENDEDGFYSRLGFALIDESVLTVEYKFCYTSNGGFAQRYFTIPMTEETIVELIRMLESKLTYKEFAKEQRALMTSKLRDYIKKRDNYTCRCCGNSIYHEPNLLLEVDHIMPVSKGGYTVENNLQTLCWKCNRAKSNKI